MRLNDPTNPLDIYPILDHIQAVIRIARENGSPGDRADWSACWISLDKALDYLSENNLDALSGRGIRTP